MFSCCLWEVGCGGLWEGDARVGQRLCPICGVDGEEVPGSQQPAGWGGEPVKQQLGIQLFALGLLPAPQLQLYPCSQECALGKPRRLLGLLGAGATQADMMFSQVLCSRESTAQRGPWAGGQCGRGQSPGTRARWLAALPWSSLLMDQDSAESVCLIQACVPVT